MDVTFASIEDINFLMSLDYRCYQFPLPKKTYQKMIGKAFTLTANVDGRPVGFGVWSRGTLKTDAKLYRLGVLPGFINPAYMMPSDMLRVEAGFVKPPIYRRKGIARQMMTVIEADIKQRGKSNTLRTIVPEHKLLGEKDPDDISGFMTKTGWEPLEKWERGMFNEYGRAWDGIIFRKKVA